MSSPESDCLNLCKEFFHIVVGLKRAANNSQSVDNSQLSLAHDKILSVNNGHDIFTKLYMYTIPKTFTL